MQLRQRYDKSVNSSPYDTVATWYPQWVDAWQPAVLEFGRDLFPEELSAVRVLDVACGHGRLTRELSGADADVVGVDASAALIATARARESDGGPSVQYHHADVADLDAWWDGEPFDGAASEMALMDVADLPGVVHA